MKCLILAAALLLGVASQASAYNSGPSWGFNVSVGTPAPVYSPRPYPSGYSAGYDRGYDRGYAEGAWRGYVPPPPPVYVYKHKPKHHRHPHYYRGW